VTDPLFLILPQRKIPGLPILNFYKINQLMSQNPYQSKCLSSNTVMIEGYASTKLIPDIVETLL
jgi:hypothetical protein